MTPNFFQSRVYIIAEGPEGPVKIGRSRAPSARLSELQTGNARKLRLVYEFSIPELDAIEAERLLHEWLGEHRLEGEWFALSEDEARANLERFFDMAKTQGII